MQRALRSRFVVIINADAISGSPLRFALTYIRAVLFGCRFPADEDENDKTASN